MREESEPEVYEDTMLVSNAREGDRAAFGSLYDRYSRMVHGILLAKVPGREVDDLVQDVFLLALRRLSTLRETSSFGAWLARITRNQPNDYHRHSVPEDPLANDASEKEIKYGNSGGDHQSAAVAILDAVRSLPDAYREPLILRLVEGMTGPEIAARTGLTHGSVRVNLYRGMQQLRAKLSPNPTEDRPARRGDVVIMNTGNNRTENEAVARGDDYLWDGLGKPDPEIQRLEVLLRRFRHDRHAPEFPKIVPDRRWTFLPKRVGLFPALATAAVVAAIAAAIFVIHARKSSPAAGAGWNASRVAGTPRIGTRAISRNETSRLGVGQMLETDSQSRARLQADDTGQIEVDPSTRLRLLTMSPGLKRIVLDRGTIHTYIWAPAGEFVVDTPSAVIVDLGCAYTVQVDDSGAGLVRTSRGWVGFELNGREAFIPEGAACATRPKVGPGTPYFEDASSEFRAALARFDLEDTTQQRAGDLATVLDQARKRDALTLWHLLARVEDEGQRVLVYDRLRELAPPPAGVTQEGILRLDQPMFDLWWNELGFDDISVWRHWERSWSGAPSPVREK